MRVGTADAERMKLVEDACARKGEDVPVPLSPAPLALPHLPPSPRIRIPSKAQARGAATAYAFRSACDDPGSARYTAAPRSIATAHSLDMAWAHAAAIPIGVHGGGAALPDCAASAARAAVGA